MVRSTLRRRGCPCDTLPLTLLGRLGYDGNWSPYVVHPEHELLSLLKTISQHYDPGGYSVDLRRGVREHRQSGNVGDWARRL